MQLHHIWVMFQKISVDNIKTGYKIELNGYVYDLSVDYDSINVSEILDIHKYLMVKNNIK